MRIRTIRRTFIPQHIEQFSRTGGWVNFQYLPGIKFMRATSTEPLLCLSTNSGKKSLYELPFLLPPLPVIHLQVFLPFLWEENQRGGKKKKKKEEVSFGRQIGFFFHVERACSHIACKY